jgi:H/ACA ribonucleoprotein complex non-core subunit NAF1
MPTHDDLDVSDSDDNDDSSTMVSDNHSVTHSHTPQAPVSDLDFVAALAQAEIDLIHSTTAGTGDECENDEVDECANMEEVNVESEDSSSSDDDDDDVSENGAIKAMANSDDEFDAPVSSAIPRTKNEIGADDIDVEVEKVELLEDEKLDLVGTVMSVVPSEHTIVIQSITTQTPLDEGSVLCLGDRKVIGKISELFGPLSAPFYIVKHKSSPTHSDENSEGVETADENSTGKRKTELAHIDDIQQGVSVFVAVQHSSYVTPHSLSIIRNIKGSDASNMWDEEVSLIVFHL